MLNKATTRFGVDFFVGDKIQLLSIINRSIESPYSYIVTPNIDHVYLLSRDCAMVDAYKKARYRICDSRILFFLLKTLGLKINEVIPGSDLTLSLFEMANQKRFRVLVIGGSDLEVEILEEKYPHVNIHHYNPPMGFIDSDVEVLRCLEFIKQNPSEVILFAVGAPRQEVLASLVDPRECKGIGICVGASISFASGTVKRAPVMLQKVGLEWLHRLLNEPGRLSARYAKDFLFIVPAYIKEIIGVYFRG